MGDARIQITVGWVDDPDAGWSALVFGHPSGDTLEIQRDDDVDPERADGGASYCLVRGGGPTHDGGLVSCALAGGRLTLVLTAEAAGVLELPTAVELDLAPGDGERAERWLVRLLA